MVAFTLKSHNSAPYQISLALFKLSFIGVYSACPRTRESVQRPFKKMPVFPSVFASLGQNPCRFSQPPVIRTPLLALEPWTGESLLPRRDLYSQESSGFSTATYGPGTNSFHISVPPTSIHVFFFISLFMSFVQLIFRWFSRFIVL